MPRRTGSTNSSNHHKVGGPRAGSGRPPKKYQVQSNTLNTIFGRSSDAVEQVTTVTEQAPSFEQQSTNNQGANQQSEQAERNQKRRNQKLAEAIKILERLSLEEDDESIYEVLGNNDDCDDPIDYDIDTEEKESVGE